MRDCRMNDLRKIGGKTGNKSNNKARKELKVNAVNSIISDTLTIYSNTMFKTQLYLPNKANEMLDKLAKKIGSSKSELVRKAVDEFLQKYDKTKLKEAYGIWKDYEIDLRGMRDDWKR
jgi:uncharacterized membrane-anchored protein YjiN (DUF445 family)